jgi:hypothetical protein
MNAAAHPMLSTLIFVLFFLVWLLLMGYLLPKLGIPT